MEDVEICKRLLQHSKPACSHEKITTSARRWIQNGIWRTIFLMWRFRIAYFFGADPTYLAKKYRQVR